VKIGYMPQVISFDDMEATVLDTLRAEIGVPEEKARGILARFQFVSADVMKKVGTLSGGEKSRLKLCLMMQTNINFLLLDEPTNHLDIASREWLENALSDFEGTMLFVSHDRYFLNRFADKVWSMENGTVTRHDYGYEEYIETLRKDTVLEEVPKKVKVKTKVASQKSAVVSVETRIMEAEAELSKVKAEIEMDLLKADYSKMSELHEKMNRLEARIDTLYHEWFAGGCGC